MTNNVSESWNRQINTLLDKISMKKFIHILQTLEQEQQTKCINNLQNINIELENEKIIEERVRKNKRRQFTFDATYPKRKKTSQYLKLKVTELKIILKNRGLSTTGRKIDR
jgi:hypothetical protein